MAAREPRTPGADWLLSGLLLVAIALALGSLSSVVTRFAWWAESVGVAAVILLIAAIVRSFARHRLWGTLAAFLASVTVITFLFAPATALLAIIPTPASLGELRSLTGAGLDSIAVQSVPADAGPGIMFLVCLGVAGIAFTADTLAFAFRSPALTGLPLLALLLVPTVISPRLNDALFFALTAVAWLAILLVRAPAAGRRAALGIGVVGVLAALVIPAIAPVPQGAAPSGRAGFAAGINPIVTLGDNLRRPDATLAATYMTSSGTGEYLRLAALDNFSGTSWTPTAEELQTQNTVSAVGAIPGLAAGVAITAETTNVTVANILSQWLPVPYAPRTVTGLKGVWAWDADALSIRTEQANARNQDYTVTSATAAPTAEQLTAAGTTVDPGLDRYLVVPDDLPAVVATTATEVVGDATSNYEKAIRLQDYFTGGLFTYSEDAPVSQGYDGSGAMVLAAFLQAKSGYCVHFASAMAAMARTLGIPARVAVGFTPGTPFKFDNDGVRSFRVSTHDLHTWPELYFSGIGWVRFEPTPGRGAAPAYAAVNVDDPSTPTVDQSKPTPVPASTTAPASTPSAKPTPSSIPVTTPSAAPVAVGPADAATGSPPSPLVVIVPLLALLAAPLVVRAIRRQRRIGMLTRGSALAGWQELRDTADDLGLRTSDSRTPRQLGADLAAHLDDRGTAALARLRVSLEGEAFAEHAEQAEQAEQAGHAGYPGHAGHAGHADIDDLHTVVRALRRDAGLGRRIVASLVPRSLFTTWLPDPVSAE
ncbi:MAG: transglutaminaseTgpA domain-containing protein [Rhodoglobus sp.]